LRRFPIKAWPGTYVPHQYRHSSEAASGVRTFYPTFFQIRTAEDFLPVTGFFDGSVLMYNELPWISN
jgi:hypothetical protein